MSSSDELGRFVRRALERGTSRDEIRALLREADWPEAEVDATLRTWAESDFPLPVPRPRPSLSAREAFEYLVFFGTLYASAFALGGLWFQFVDLGLPDPLSGDAGRRGAVEGIRWSIAALVVAWPVFLLSARSNARRLARAPAQRSSSVRRWLTYLTLAVTASVLIGDGTSLVYNLLGGAVTARFVLKAAIIALIAGTAFVYFLSDLRRDEREAAA